MASGTWRTSEPHAPGWPLLSWGLAAALALAVPVIQHFEGLRQTGNGDVVGVATSCFGHTGPDAVVGRRYSMAECGASCPRP